jgi:CRP-like cAMP-binding protein
MRLSQQLLRSSRLFPCGAKESIVANAAVLPVTNNLIDSLPHKERNRTLKFCEPVDMVFGTILCEPNQTFTEVYFPLTGFISLVATVGAHPPLEMGLIGNEGMLGATLTLGVDVVPMRAVVQGSGTALRMTAERFQQECRDNSPMQRTCNRYLYVLMAQLSQTVSCTRFHAVEARLARWLLMTHDRAHADHFHLTHEFLADMLGVRRSGITVAAGVLQTRKLISYARGEITILDRKGLEAVACECYAAVIDDYQRVIHISRSLQTSSKPYSVDGLSFRNAAGRQ